MVYNLKKTVVDELLNSITYYDTDSDDEMELIEFKIQWNKDIRARLRREMQRASDDGDSDGSSIDIDNILMELNLN